MSPRLAGWTLVAASAGFTVAGFLIGRDPIDLLFAPTLLIISVIGAVVVARIPGDPVGWLFLVLAFGSAFATFALRYGETAGGTLPGGPWMVWLAEWLLNTVAPAALILAFLFFPTGSLPSRRWKPVVWALALSWAVAAGTRALAPGPMAESGLPNPAGMASFPALGNLADMSLTFMVVVFLLLGAGSVLLRFRSALGQERAQLKWFALAAGLLAAEVLLANLLDVFLPPDSNLALWVSALAFNMGLLSVPAAMAVAILRYRLYDIDLVINRTLVYAGLTAILGLVYVGSVVVLGGLLRPLAGSNDLAVAGSTLAVAALFSPARRRIQAFVDRRFYRRRYDAARTVEAFSARLRDEVHLDTLSLDLQTVVRETLQPASVSVWIREARQ